MEWVWVTVDRCRWFPTVVLKGRSESQFLGLAFHKDQQRLAEPFSRCSLPESHFGYDPVPGIDAQPHGPQDLQLGLGLGRVVLAPDVVKPVHNAAQPSESAEKF
jgi:hypothetical protein